MIIAHKMDGFFVAVQQTPFHDPCVEFANDISFGTAEIHSAFRDGIAHGRLELHAHIIAVFKDCHGVIHKVGIAAEGGIDGVCIPPGFLETLGIFFIERFIFRNKEIPSAEGCDPTHFAVHKPVDQIEVVTAFFQNVRTGFAGESAPVFHDVGAVIRRDIFIGINTDQIAELTGGEQFFHFPVDGGETQHESRGEFHAGFLMRSKNLLAVFDTGGEGFFREDMFAFFEAFQNPVFVISVGRKDHHPFHAGKRHRFLVTFADRHFRLIPDFFGHGAHTLFAVGIVSCHHLNIPLGIADQVFDHILSPCTAADHCHFHDLAGVLFCFFTAFRFRHVIFSLI